MNQVNNWIDSAIQQVINGAIREAPVPRVRGRIDAMPRYSIASVPNSEFTHEIDIFTPVLIVLSKFVFIQRPPGLRPRRGDERILDSGRPEKRLSSEQLFPCNIGKPHSFRQLRLRPMRPPPIFTVDACKNLHAERRLVDSESRLRSRSGFQPGERDAPDMRSASLRDWEDRLTRKAVLLSRFFKPNGGMFENYRVSGN